MASGPSPIISLPLPLHTGNRDSQTAPCSLGPSPHHGSADTPCPHSHTVFASLAHCLPGDKCASALSVYHHLWRAESALELGYNPTHAAHTGEKHPLPEEGSLGRERPLSLQRQLRGRPEFRKSLQSGIRRAEAANREMKQLPGCEPKAPGLGPGSPSITRHLEPDHAGKEAGCPLQGPHQSSFMRPGCWGHRVPIRTSEKTVPCSSSGPGAARAPCCWAELLPQGLEPISASRPLSPDLSQALQLSPSSRFLPASRPVHLLARVRFSGSHLSSRLCATYLLSPGDQGMLS